MPPENAWALAWFGVGDTITAAPSGTPFSIGDGNIMTNSLVGHKKEATIVIPVAVIIAYTNKPVHSTPLLPAESLL